MAQLQVKQFPSAKHTELVSGASWSASNELATVADDKTVWIWNVDGEPQAKLVEVDSYCTTVQWHPSAAGRKDEGILAVSCTDGSFKLISKTGRIEKSVAAHQGAVTALRWSPDGTSLATCGEDAVVKSWSRNGMFRASIAQADGPIYAMCWSAESDQVAFTNGKHLAIRPLQPSSKQTQWKAHDAPVLSLDWNAVNGLLVSGGEDCRYRVWDCYGRQLYSSAGVEYSITSVAWAPSGRYFAAGSFNMLRLCDRTGWSYSREYNECGSIFGLAWTADSTQVAAACGSGAVLFGQLVRREVCAGPWEVRQEEPASLTVLNVVEDTREDLTFKDRVAEMSLSMGHLVVMTATQCCIYSTSNWNTPHIIELRGTVSLILQAPSHFLMVDTVFGVQVLNYEGRVLSQPKFQGMRAERLSASTVAYSADVMACVDHSDAKTVSARTRGGLRSKTAPRRVCFRTRHVRDRSGRVQVRLLDPLSGKQLSSLTHSIEVDELALSQARDRAEMSP